MLRINPLAPLSTARQLKSRLLQFGASSDAKRPWLPTRSRHRNRPSERDPKIYEAVIDQFEVETRERYRPKRRGLQETYCNIFVWDVTSAMGAEVPHWIQPNGDPAIAGRGKETTANHAISWLKEHGARFGWREAVKSTALNSANNGYPTVACWLNESGPGHMAVVRPCEGDGGDLLVAQAGERNANALRLDDAFPTAWRRGEIRYFVHD